MPEQAEAVSPAAPSQQLASRDHDTIPAVGILSCTWGASCSWCSSCWEPCQSLHVALPPSCCKESPPAISSSQHLAAALSRQTLPDYNLTTCLLSTCSIFEERSRLSRQLVDTVLPQIDSGSDQVIAHAGSDNSKLTQLSEDLEQNLREEQQFNVQMLYAVFKFQLNPLQVCCLSGAVKCRMQQCGVITAAALLCVPAQQRAAMQGSSVCGAQSICRHLHLGVTNLP